MSDASTSTGIPTINRTSSYFRSLPTSEDDSDFDKAPAYPTPTARGSSLEGTTVASTEKPDILFTATCKASRGRDGTYKKEVKFYSSTPWHTKPRQQENKDGGILDLGQQHVSAVPDSQEPKPLLVVRQIFYGHMLLSAAPVIVDPIPDIPDQAQVYVTQSRHRGSVRYHGRKRNETAEDYCVEREGEVAVQIMSPILREVLRGIISYYPYEQANFGVPIEIHEPFVSISRQFL
jgi:hypothetical protein